MVRIINSPRDEPEHSRGAEVFALQQDFQARLADETLRYLRSLRGLLGPPPPVLSCGRNPAWPCKEKEGPVTSRKSVLKSKISNRST